MQFIVKMEMCGFRLVHSTYECCNISLSRKLVKILRYVAKGWTPIEEVLGYLDSDWSLHELLSVVRRDTNRFDLQGHFIRAK